MNIGENIRRARKNAGLTQKELDEKLGISAAAVGQFEKEDANLQNSTVQKIAAVLEISPLSLYDQEPSQNTLQRTHTYVEHLSSQEARLLAYFHMLNSTGQQECIKRIKELTQLAEYQKLITGNP